MFSHLDPVELPTLEISGKRQFRTSTTTPNKGKGAAGEIILHLALAPCRSQRYVIGPHTVSD